MTGLSLVDNGSHKSLGFTPENHLIVGGLKRKGMMLRLYRDKNTNPIKTQTHDPQQDDGKDLVKLLFS